MNNKRRKRVQGVIDKISELASMMEELREEVESIKEEEEECRDNMPENLQASERYEITDNAVNNLDSAIDWFDSADTEDLISYLTEAMQ